MHFGNLLEHIFRAWNLQPTEKASLDISKTSWLIYLSSIHPRLQSQVINCIVDLNKEKFNLTNFQNRKENTSFQRDFSETVKAVN